MKAVQCLGTVCQSGQCVESGQPFELLFHPDLIVGDTQGGDQPIGIAVGIHVGLPVAVDPVVIAVGGTNSEPLQNRFAAGDLLQRGCDRVEIAGVDVACEV